MTAGRQIFVRPTVPLVPEQIALSAFDQFNGRHYSPLLLVFRVSDMKLFDTIISDLQEGLARLLDDIPFLAGNLITDGDNRDYLVLDIEEDGGVLLKVKNLTDGSEGPSLDFDDLERLGFPASSFNSRVLCPLSFAPAEVAPCLQVQVNLIRGGIILTMYPHHSMLDGDGTTGVLTRFAKHVAAVSESRILPLSDIIPAEAFDRSALIPEQKAKRKLYDFPSFEDGRGKVMGTSWWNVAQRLEMEGDLATSGLSISHWYISKDNIRQLEEKTAPKNPKDVKITGGTVLSAFLFRHFTRARRLEQQGIDQASYHNPLNVRSRMEPAIHPEYLGNCVVPSVTHLPLSEIYSSDEDALYRIASAISKTIDWWDSDKIWDLLGAMEAWPRVRDIERTMDLYHATDLHLTNLSAFPMLNSYWGTNLGKLHGLRIPNISLMDGFGIIMPRSADGGIEIILIMETDKLEVLKADKEFKRHAQFLCS